MSDKPYMLKRLADVTPTPCPCGSSRRMFTQADGVMIPPGTVHAANGRFELMVVVSPPFDPEDEHLMEAGGGSSAADNT